MDRRELLATGAALATCSTIRSAASAGVDKPVGIVIGQDEGAAAGMELLKAGGNAVDAIVAAALVAGVVSVPMCGIGGYGGSALVALPDGKTTAIDFNSTAPAAAQERMFNADANGKVARNANYHGWLAAGVPGTLAGLQEALTRFGRKRFSEVVQPALRYAADGFPVSRSLSANLQSAKALLADEGSRRLFFPNGKAYPAGSIFRNPRLAGLLERLAADDSVESFYRGAVGSEIAAAFSKNGGLVTVADLANYRAIASEPLRLAWEDRIICTPPPTAGGLTVLHALGLWRQFRQMAPSTSGARLAHAQLDVLRLAWRDRLQLLGDPNALPAGQHMTLLSADRWSRQAAQIQAAVDTAVPVDAGSDGLSAGGTIHLSSADADGMMVALTLTHGGGFGAQVVVESLGLLLGHGMSRFDPRPGRANSIGPGKRPLHNMCPTIVLREGKPRLALGGRGGRKIPNAVFQVLMELLDRRRTIEQAIQAPRMHTEGDRTATFERHWGTLERDYLAQVGFRCLTAPSAVVHAVEFASNGNFIAVWR